MPVSLFESAGGSLCKKCNLNLRKRERHEMIDVSFQVCAFSSLAFPHYLSNENKIGTIVLY